MLLLMCLLFDEVGHNVQDGLTWNNYKKVWQPKSVTESESSNAYRSGGCVHNNSSFTSCYWSFMLSANFLSCFIDFKFLTSLYLHMLPS